MNVMSHASCCVVSLHHRSQGLGQRTYAIEMVASANGSPTIWPVTSSESYFIPPSPHIIPKLKPGRLLPEFATKFPFILRKEGGERLPYEGIDYFGEDVCTLFRIRYDFLTITSFLPIVVIRDRQRLGFSSQSRTSKSQV